MAKKRFLISLLSAAVFFAIMNPETFKATAAILGKWISDSSGCPTPAGLVLHVAVFAAVALAMMGKFSTEKLKISLFSACLVYIVSNKNTYMLTRKLLGDWVAGPAGCPRPGGLALHTVVYLILTYVVMNNKSVKKSS